MYFPYILKSEKFPRHYIGISDDTSRRLDQHNRGEVRSTKAYVPYKILAIEQFEDKPDARKREIFLKKTAAARNAIFLAKASSSSG